jgi:ribonuclease-3
LIRLLRKIKYKNNADNALLESLHNLLGFYPKNLKLYQQAFRHKSSHKIKEGVTDSNERLEYLGDAVLGTVVAEYLFKKYPLKDEGFLTKVRSRIVSRENLANVSRKMGLENLIEKNNSRFGNKSIGGDAFEALIGAIYLDKGFIKTKKFIVDRILRTLIDIETIEEKDTDYKSQMIEWSQRKRRKIDFKLILEEGKSHDRTYHIEIWSDDMYLGKGKASSKKKAEQFASEDALKLIYEKGI